MTTKTRTTIKVVLYHIVQRNFERRCSGTRKTGMGKTRSRRGWIKATSHQLSCVYAAAKSIAEC